MYNVHRHCDRHTEIGRHHSGNILNLPSLSCLSGLNSMIPVPAPSGLECYVINGTIWNTVIQPNIYIYILLLLNNIVTLLNFFFKE